MKLSDINVALEAMLDAVDPDTGELLCDPDELEALALEREEKLEGLALYVKNCRAEAEAIKAEKLALEKRQKTAENKAERAKSFLQAMLAGEKLKTPRASVSYRRTESPKIVDEAAFWRYAADHNELVRRKDPEVDLVAVKAAIQAGEAVPGAEIVSKQSVIIK